MSFRIGSSSYLLNDSDSSDEFNLLLAEIAQTEETITRMIMNNNKILMHYLERQGNNTSTRVGSVPGHAMINRNRENVDRNLFDDYFAENPRYNEDMFRRRYRMSRNLFLRIVDAVKSRDNYFQQGRDGVGKLGLSTLQKVTAAFRMLAYGLPADAIDEYLKIGESTAIESIKRFCCAVMEIFSYRYLREPNANDIARLLYIGQQRGFPGMLGSLDCMHWKWKNCPTAWAGQYTGRSGSPTIILEAVADYDLWIWHAYFGMPGSNNDINVLENSNLFSNLANGIAASANYTIQGKEYTMGYYLTDNIYPKWATLVQTIREPQTRKKKYLL
ncbi:hypothetical protein Sjap_008114 [Stephania japonica]|uniref:Uncharacterized protein n=1 Tax=Stephania japonica TaxID=461633 RepID=A0AAP0JR46_9MAGN